MPPAPFFVIEEPAPVVTSVLPKLMKLLALPVITELEKVILLFVVGLLATPTVAFSARVTFPSVTVCEPVLLPALTIFEKLYAVPVLAKNADEPDTQAPLYVPVGLPAEFVDQRAESQEVVDPEVV